MTALLLFALALPLQGAPAAPPAESSQAATATPDADAEALRLKLKSVKRIYVDSFGEDTIAKQIQAMVVSSLAETKRFVITENKDKADAFLRGTAVEKTSQEFHSNREGTAAGGVVARERVLGQQAWRFTMRALQRKPWTAHASPYASSPPTET